MTIKSDKWIRRMAQQHGMRLSIEAYGGPCDNAPYAGRADEHPPVELDSRHAAHRTDRALDDDAVARGTKPERHLEAGPGARNASE